MDVAAVRNESPPDAKIALFRSLFRGREDVYARRFESRKTGKSGYTPVCANQWVRGVCDKPRTKCLSCRHQQYLPMTDEVMRWHLSGQDDRGADFVAGVYPMLLDEACHFLAMDFDKQGWRDDALAVLATCSRLQSARRTRTFTIWQWWSYLDVLRGFDSRRNSSKIRGAHSHRDDGASSRDRAGLVRPSLSESGHTTTGRFWKLDRSAATERTESSRQQCVY